MSAGKNFRIRGRMPGRHPQTMPRFSSIATMMKMMAPLSTRIGSEYTLVISQKEEGQVNTYMSGPRNLRIGPAK